MGRYLVVAHQTAESHELIKRAQSISQADARAEFTVLVPATPVHHLLGWTEGETQEVALRKAAAAGRRFQLAGLRLRASIVGDANPLLALEDELREQGDYYDAVIVCTFPPGKSRWLRLDLPRRAKRLAPRVIHVVAQPVEGKSF